MKNCNSCGKCCTKYGNGGLSASPSDLDIWESLRPDIAQYVHNGQIWMDPEKHNQLALCPWLRKDSKLAGYTCAIYYDRPEDCRIYPATVADMIKDDCEMLERRDLIDLKQAQKELDGLKEL